MKSKLIIFVVLVSIFMCSFQSFAIELAQTSIDGPCTRSYGQYYGQNGKEYRNYIAWTDLNKKINIVVNYYDGTTSSVVLNETSNFKPSIEEVSDNRVVIAWTGTDGRINIMFSTNGLNFTKKWTFEERSLCAPCLGHDDTQTVSLAWTGTNKQINHASFYPYSGQLGDKITFKETSSYSPALYGTAYDHYLAWTGEDNRINYMVSPNYKFIGAIKKTTNYLSNTAPTFTSNDDTRVILGWAASNNHLYTIKIDWTGKSSEYKSYDSYFSFYSPSLYTNWRDMKCYIAWTSRSNSKINVQPIY